MCVPMQVWYSKFYRTAELHLRKIYEVNQLQEGRGWLLPAGAQPNNTACRESEQCFMRHISLPDHGSVAPVPLSDFNFQGDINSTLTPPVSGSVPFYTGDAINSTCFPHNMA
jgi:hypothetical protein